MSISNRLQKVISGLNRSTKEVATEIGLTYQSLNNYLRGDREPNSEALEKISRLGVNLHWLLTGEGAMFVQERDTLDFLVKEFEKFSDVRPPEPLSISAASFVDLYNNHGEDFSCFPEWLRRRIPRLELREFQSLVANKGHKTDEAYPLGKTVTLPHNPLLATRIGEALFKTYGAAWNALDEKIRIGLYGAIYSTLCQLGGATEIVEPSIEDIETVLKLAIKYGGAPAPAQEEKTLTSKELSKAIWENALERHSNRMKAIEDAKKGK